MERKKFKLDVSSTRTRRILFYLTLIVLPILVGVICLCIGRFTTTPSETLSALGRILTQDIAPGDTLAKIIRDMRLPRIALAILVGGGLSVAGLAFQSLFANPMASPDTLGVAAGASFGAVLALLFDANTLVTQFSALLMGFVAVGLTLTIGKGKGADSSLTAMILGGMVISSLFSALISLVKLVADTDAKLPAITYWLMGSLNDATWYTVMFALPFILTGIVILYAIRWRLNILPMSEDEILASGSNVNVLRMTTAFASTMITAACVSTCGQVGWVGLLIPHICRMAFGSDNLILVPASVSFGAVFMILVDTAARSLSPSEIPVSVLTAIIGAPVFIALLRKTGGWSL